MIKEIIKNNFILEKNNKFYTIDIYTENFKVTSSKDRTKIEELASEAESYFAELYIEHLLNLEPDIFVDYTKNQYALCLSDSFLDTLDDKLTSHKYKVTSLTTSCPPKSLIAKNKTDFINFVSWIISKKQNTDIDIIKLAKKYFTRFSTTKISNN